MKFLDANIFLRFLGTTETDEDIAKQRDCAALFVQVEEGLLDITTSESVLHEVLYVCCSPRQYGQSHERAAGALRQIVALRSFHYEGKVNLLRALDIFASHAFLDFADAMSIVHSQSRGLDLLSYDSDFDRVAGVHRQLPEKVP